MHSTPSYQVLKYINKTNMASKRRNPYKYVKKTLVHSPIITNIFPVFNVDIAKKFRGVPTNSVDESDQYLVPKEDSQMDAFSDDDDEFSIIGGINTTPNQLPPYTKSDSPKVPELVAIKVIVKVTSLLVNNVEFSFPAPIRSSCVVNGIKDNETGQHGEDSLLISLKSGFLFLIRVFLIPRHFTDKYYETNQSSDINNNTSLIFKPFIVQWWDTSSGLQSPALDSSGYQLFSHSSGLAAVSTSASNVFRIYNTKPTEAGIVFAPHINVPVDGIILNACFSEPLVDCIDQNHIMFIALIFTEHRRLEINLFEWQANQQTTINNLSKKTLPLNNSFPIPIFIVPLGKNSSFLFVSESEMTVVTVHQIMSVEYDFHTESMNNISFPTSFYIPFSNISNIMDDEIDEFILATDSGNLYSVLVDGNSKITVNPIARMSDPIAVFVMERVANEYSLIFGSDTGSNREVIIADLFDQSDENDSNRRYSKTKLITDYKNWAPLLDVSIIDSVKSRNLRNYADQEVWTLAGVGKRTKLTQIRSGYGAERMGKVFSNLRKGEQLFVYTANDKLFFILSYSFHTKVYEYHDDAEDESEMLVELDNKSSMLLILDEATIICSTLPDRKLLQITNTSVCLSDFSGRSCRETFPKRFVFGDVLGPFLALVSEETLEFDGSNSVISSVDIMKYTNEDNIVESNQISDYFTKVGSIPLNFEPSVSKMFKMNNDHYLAIGSYEGSLHIWNLTDFSLLSTLQLDAFNPYPKGYENGTEHLIVPNDILFYDALGTSQIGVGSKDGFYITLKIDLDCDLQNQPRFKCEQFLKLSDTAIQFYKLRDDDFMYFIISRNLWLVNMYESIYPQKVFFNENSDRAVYSLVQLKNPTGPNHITSPIMKYFGFLKEDGVSVGIIHTTSRVPAIRQISVGENAKKLMYLPFVTSFILLCSSKSSNGRLKFVDRKSLKTIKHYEYSKGKLVDSISGESDIPVCVSIWSIQRNYNRVSKKILVGYSLENNTKGCMKILDITSNSAKSADSLPSITVSELNSFDWKEPISCIGQFDDSIIFSSGNTINSTSYNVSERRLNTVCTLGTLSSEVISFTIDKTGGNLLVTTRSDSLYKFTYGKLPSGGEKFELSATDPSPKGLVNEAQFVDTEVAVADKLHSSVLIMSQKGPVLQEELQYKMSSIPRVFTCRIQSIWEEDTRLDFPIHGEYKDTPLNQVVNTFDGIHITSAINDIKEAEIEDALDEIEKDENEVQSRNLLSVGVNGEMTVIRKVAKSSDFFPSVNDLDLPFSDKVNGKGLFSLYKPYFNYKDNKGSVFDLDLDTIAKQSSINITL